MVRSTMFSTLLALFSFTIFITTAIAQQTFTNPTSSSVLTAGQQITVTWTNIQSNDSTVSIILCHGTSDCDDTIVTTSNDGSYDWTIASDTSARTDYFLLFQDGTTTLGASSAFTINTASSSSSSSSSSASSASSASSVSSASSSSAAQSSSSSSAAAPTSSSSTPATTTNDSSSRSTSTGGTPTTTSTGSHTTSTGVAAGGATTESDKYVSSTSYIPSTVAVTVTYTDSAGHTTDSVSSAATSVATVVSVPQTSTSSKSTSHTGAIVGGAVGGGVGALILLALLFFFCRRASKRKQAGYAATAAAKRDDVESKGDSTPAFGEKDKSGSRPITPAPSVAAAVKAKVAEAHPGAVEAPSDNQIVELPAGQQEPVEIAGQPIATSPKATFFAEIDGREIQRPDTAGGTNFRNLRSADQNTPAIQLSTPNDLASESPARGQLGTTTRDTNTTSRPPAEEGELPQSTGPLPVMNLGGSLSSRMT